jgi:hypothetical protein
MDTIGMERNKLTETSKFQEDKPTQKYYKFLGGNLKCGYSDKHFYYPAPTPQYDRNGELKGWKPSAWITEPNADTISKDACGVGLHLMKIPNPRYVRYIGNAYLAEGKTLLGEDDEKARFKSIRLLRPLEKSEIFYPKTNLPGANLSGANLSEANLFRANLSWADLSWADLPGANLSEANLSEANLSGAKLTKNSLSKTQLQEARNTDKIHWID